MINRIEPHAIRGKNGCWWLHLRGYYYPSLKEVLKNLLNSRIIKVYYPVLVPPQLTNEFSPPPWGTSKSALPVLRVCK